MDEKEMRARRDGLENYLKTLLNERIYLVKPLFDFIEFDPNKSDLFRDVKPTDTSGYRAVSLGPAEIIDGKNQYTVYKYSIEDTLSLTQVRIIQKRYSDFEALHEALKVHFHGAQELPDLPAKFNTFGITTTVAYREAGFRAYLNALFKVQGILDSVKFRQFIGW